eukprot:1160785-Pelagomonas_calceolata.AAC.4
MHNEKGHFHNFPDASESCHISFPGLPKNVKGIICCMRALEAHCKKLLFACSFPAACHARSALNTVTDVVGAGLAPLSLRPQALHQPGCSVHSQQRGCALNPHGDRVVRKLWQLKVAHVSLNLCHSTL